jgi:hypothetical protein
MSPPVPEKMRMFIEDKRKGKASLRYNEQTILKQCKEVRRFLVFQKRRALPPGAFCF